MENKREEEQIRVKKQFWMNLTLVGIGILAGVAITLTAIGFAMFR